jgi:hypothetical protein
MAWLGLTALSLLLFAVGFPIYVAALHSVCTSAVCPSVQLSRAGAHVLERVGLSLNTYAALVTVDTLVVLSIFCAVAGVMVWRRSDDWLALLVGYMLVALSIALVSGSLAVPDPAWRFADSLASFVGAGPALFLVFYLFPDGSFTPRWLGWVLLVGVGVEAGNTLFPGSALDVDHWVPNLENLCFFGILAALAGAQIYRYQRVYTPLQRQQSKWVIFSVAVFAAFGLVVYVPGPLLAPAGGRAALLLSVLAPLIFVNGFALLFPLSFAFAILRYRLWDIDVIIRRTLIYGSLSAILAAVYFGVVLGTQAVVQALTGQTGQQPVFTVASTLVIVVLFTPLRRRIQAVIDRRFYRSKYDGVRTVETFGRALRTETNLAHLSEQLVTVVQETVQPVHVWLWLRPLRQAEESLLQETWGHVSDGVSALGSPADPPPSEPFAERP